MEVLAAEIIETGRKTEESLKKLMKRDVAAGASDQQATDMDKITVQIFLDLRELVTQVDSLDVSVDVKTLASYPRLATLLKPAEKFVT